MDTRENRTNTSTLTNAEVEAAAALLAKLEPGFLPYPIFGQFCRLATMATVELVIVRTAADGTVEVWLRKRMPDDSIWPDKWCNPGGIIRPTDSLESVFARLAEEDLAGAAYAAAPAFAGFSLNPANKRGQTAMAIYWAEVVAPPAEGAFFPADALPEDFIAEQQPLLEIAVAAYRGRAAARS